MDNLKIILCLPQDDRTGEIYFRGRWYSKEEYLELREEIARDEHERDCAAEDFSGFDGAA